MNNVSESLKNNNVSSHNQIKEKKFVHFEVDPNAKLKVLFVGNSITRHSPKADIGWLIDWGMAASAKENDFVHIIVDQMRKKYENISFCIAQAAEWETKYFNGKEVLDEYYQDVSDFEADIVIVRIGENINRDRNKEIACKPYFDEMVKFFASNPKAKVIVTDLFWRTEVLDVQIKEIINENGYTYVEIGDLDAFDKYKAIGMFEHRGVSLHPGDLGMRKIAERILKALDIEYKAE